jgi:hypothetical protein
MPRAWQADGGGIERVFGKDHRVVVGECDALAIQLMRDLGDLLRAGGLHQSIHILRLGDVPVLAELAGQIASGSAERQD